METCKKSSAKLEMSINIFLHVLILFTFLTIFFIMFVSKLTKKAFENEVGHLIEENLGKAIDDLEPEKKQEISDGLRLFPFDKFEKRYQQPTEFIEERNYFIQLGAIITSIIGIVGLILIIFILKSTCGICVPISHIITENFITFIFIGLVEYMFFVNVAFKFVPSPPSLLVKTLINNFKQSLVSN